MKIKATKTEIKNQSTKIYAVGYCGGQALLADLHPFAYSAGAMGWACDYYDLGGGCVLATGYDTDRLGAVRVDNILEQYNKQAPTGWGDDKKQKRAALFAEFVEQIKKL